MANAAIDTFGNMFVTIRDGVTGAIANALSSADLRSNTGTATSVASSTSDVTVLAANSNRKGGTITNDSTSVLYILLSAGTSSTTNYTAQVPAAGYYELPFGYSGVVKGLWASANGNARVTEFV